MKIPPREAIIHLLWTVGVILMFGIWQFSTVWASSTDLVQAISLAVGITSFVVGVYAIFQGLVSGSSLNAVAEGLRGSAEQVSNAASRVESASQELSCKIETIPAQISDMAFKLDSIYLSMESIGESKLKSSSKRTIYDEFRPNEIISLYAVVKSSETGKPVHTRSIFGDEFPFGFTHGYLSALARYGIIDAHQDLDEPGFVINGINDLSPEEIKNRIENLSERAYVSKNKPLIDKFFAENS